MVLNTPERRTSGIKETAASRRNLEKNRQIMTEIAVPLAMSPIVETEEPIDVPITTPDESNWRGFAVCLQNDPELFFPENEDTDSEKAKKICGRCAVDSFCLQLAIDNDEKFGIWGGLTADEIRDLKRRPRRRR